MTVLSLPPQISKKIYKVKNLKKSEIIKTKLENGGMQNSSPVSLKIPETTRCLVPSSGA